MIAFQRKSAEDKYHTLTNSVSDFRLFSIADSLTVYKLEKLSTFAWLGATRFIGVAPTNDYTMILITYSIQLFF